MIVKNDRCPKCCCELETYVSYGDTYIRCKNDHCEFDAFLGDGEWQRDIFGNYTGRKDPWWVRRAE